jgi:ribosomal protein RSM22 (predicted rRNA methylase)
MAIDRALSGIAVGEIAERAAALSLRYRDERRDGKLHVTTRDDVYAYLATRLPATYAAVRAALGAIAETCPDFSPTIALDVGAGPGTVLWAAADCWNSLADVVLTEASPLFAAVGQQLAIDAALPRNTWHIADLAKDDIESASCDLVTAAYVFNELAPEIRPRTLERLWRATKQMLVIVEPGTPAGWQRIIDMRFRLIDAGGHVVAPCPHDHACPLQAPDWCHFAQRVARSRLHRQAKGADVPWEDEKFSYVAVSRKPPTNSASRVIARPRKAGGHVTLKLCRPDGTASTEVISRRDGTLFKSARRIDWGSSL